LLESNIEYQIGQYGLKNAKDYVILQTCGTH